MRRMLTWVQSPSRGASRSTPPDPATPRAESRHGFPTSSRMFRTLIPVLAERLESRDATAR
jgi:hypothetical protein